MIKMIELDAKWFSELSGEEVKEVFQVGDHDAEDEGYTTVTHHDDDTWSFFHQDRVWYFSNREEVADFAAKHGFVF